MRTRLMGASQAAAPSPLSGPPCWLADLVAFNEELRRLFVDHMSDAGILSAKRVRDIVAEHYGLTLAEIAGRRATRRCAWPRQIGMYICVRHAGLASTRIGEVFGGRDHSTVLHAVRAVTARMANDSELTAEVAALIETCRAGAPA
jgi:chromosomal replication initiation ATPase DnaA